VLNQETQGYGMVLEELNKAIIIGNGESRKKLNLEYYQTGSTLIGCNAIHRDMVVNHLICCDRRMAEESTNNPDTKNTKIYVRDNWYHYFRKIKKNKNIEHLPQLPYQGTSKKDKPEHWGSGGYAILLGANLGFKELEIVGFDLYSTDNLVNNVYKDTNNYSNANSQSVDPSYWIYQIEQIFKYYPNTKFIIRNSPQWKLPTEWQKNNVSFVAL